MSANVGKQRGRGNSPMVWTVSNFVGSRRERRFNAAAYRDYVPILRNANVQIMSLEHQEGTKGTRGRGLGLTSSTPRRLGAGKYGYNESAGGGASY